MSCGTCATSGQPAAESAALSETQTVGLWALPAALLPRCPCGAWVSPRDMQCKRCGRRLGRPQPWPPFGLATSARQAAQPDWPGPRISLAPVQPILAAIRAAGGEAIVVGGSVRDSLLGQKPKDFDLEVYAVPPETLVPALQAIGAVDLVGKSFGVIKVRLPGMAEEPFDVAIPRRESKVGQGHKGFLVEPDPTMTPKEAASRRDFDWNALGVRESGEVRDYFGGVQSLQQRRLRHTSPAFADDPLRVLRGMQFAGRYGLTAAPETIELCRGLLAEYSTLAQERIWGEWEKWAAKSMAPAHGLAFLRDCGWIAAYPELVDLVGLPQDPEFHPEGDVWRHTLATVEAATRIAERDTLAGDDRTVLILAGLVHDLGKAQTTVIDEAGRIREPGHAVAGEKLARAFLQRIGAPARIAERVIALARHHMDYLGYAGGPAHVNRLAAKLGAQGESLAMLARLVEADHQGRPPLSGGLPAEMDRMLQVAKELGVKAAAPQPLLQGRDLIAAGLRPGPHFGPILRAATEQQLEGQLSTPEEAQAWLQQYLQEHAPIGKNS